MSVTLGAAPMTARERFVAALLGKPVDVQPVGNVVSSATYEQMRLLGVEWPEAHYLAEPIADLAERSYTDLGYDTIMPYFSIIMGAAGLGAKIDWGADDWEFAKDTGKIISGPRMPAVKPPNPWITPADIKIPADFLQRREPKAITDSIKLLRQRHPDACIVGKVMGPWTLAYHMFGPQEFLINILLDPDFVRACLDGLKHASVLFANAQVDAGADVITLADHSTGDLVRAESYRDFLLPVHQEIVPWIKAPVVLHCCGNTLDRMQYIKQAPFVAFHFATENDPKAAKDVMGDFKLVGNISNFVSLYRGAPDDIAQETQDVLAAGIDIPSPECAVPPQVPDANLRALAASARGVYARQDLAREPRNLADGYRQEQAQNAMPAARSP